MSEQQQITYMQTRIVRLAAESLGLSSAETLERFLSSRTAELLYREESKLWWDGPSALAEACMNEN